METTVADQHDDDPTKNRDRPVRSSDIAAGVSAEHVRAAIAEWRHVGRRRFIEQHGASKAQKYVVVEGDEEFDALALLRGARVHAGLAGAGSYRAERRTVAEPLRRLGFFVDNLESDSEGPLGADPAAYAGWAGAFTGATDGLTIRAYRREQRALRAPSGSEPGIRAPSSMRIVRARASGTAARRRPCQAATCVLRG